MEKKFPSRGAHGQDRDFKNESHPRREGPGSDNSAFVRDKRTRISGAGNYAEKVTREKREGDAPQGERRSFNPNFSRDNRFVGGGKDPDRRERRPVGSNEGRKPFERRLSDGDEKPFVRHSRGEGDGEGHKPFFNKKSFAGDTRDRDRGEGAGKPFGRTAERGHGSATGRGPAGKGYGDKPRTGKGFGERDGRRDNAKSAGKGRAAAYDKDNYPKFSPITVDKPVRLNRFIAMSGLCSRREADDYITAGVVTVNGVAVTELGSKISSLDEVRFNGEVVQGEKKVYLLMNKPKGYTTTVEDPHADKTVMDLIRGACTERIYPVGRLDKNSLGVLLFTNDGDLTKKLTHPSHMKKKVYQVTLDKPLTRADLDAISGGIVLEDGEIAADGIDWLDQGRREVGIEIHSGRNRIVRRIFEHLGYNVQKLDRVYFAGLTKKNLTRGQWRFLTPAEVAMLKSGKYE